MTDPCLIIRAVRGPICELTLNRPQAGNALSHALVAEILDHLAAIAADPAIAVVILSAAGEKIFCAGHDLKEYAAERSDPQYRQAAHQSNRLMLALHDLPQPVIAKVRGVATGAGLQLALSCDLIYAADTARFATPGVNRGFWCLKPMVPLSRTVGEKHAFQMLLTGRLYDAAFAHRIGLINEVTAPQDLDATVEDLARHVAGFSTEAVSIGKRAFYRQRDLPLEQAYAFATDVAARAIEGHDAGEGIASFVEKRPPHWQGRL